MRLALPLLAVAAATVAGCGGKDRVAGSAVGTIPTTAAGAPGTVTTTPGGPTTTAPGSTGPSSSLPVTTSTAATAAPAGSPGGLRLDGDDLGVTRAGAPFRAAVTAVSAVLGPPTGDPAPDTACLGAEDEATWASFRLGSSGGRLSGWTSTSRTLATPAGITVGSTLAALRQAYGARLQLPPPAPESRAIFLVSGSQLGGTLTGSTGADTVGSLFSGTCASQ